MGAVFFVAVFFEKNSVFFGKKHRRKKTCFLLENLFFSYFLIEFARKPFKQVAHSILDVCAVILTTKSLKLDVWFDW